MTTPPSRPPLQRCLGCRLQAAFCVCSELPHVEPVVHVVVVRHWRERAKTSNTGRILGRCVRGAVVADYGVRDEPFDPAVAALAGAWLVFPRGSAGADDDPPDPTVPTRRPTAIVLLDGTWGQARRMSHRIPGLSVLPRLALPPPRPGVDRLRKPHAPWAVSTIEAAALALQALGDVRSADQLMAAQALFTRRVRAQAGLGPR